MTEIYVIVGTGAAGIAAAERIRLCKKDVTIIMMSVDEHSHSRCMLHKFLGGERTEEELSFVEESLNEELAKIYKIVMMAYENMKKGNTLDDSSSSPKNGSHKHKSLFNTFKGRKK